MKELPNRPRFHKAYYVIPMGEDKIQLRSGQRIIVFNGRHIGELLPMIVSKLDGYHTTKEVLSSFPGVKEKAVETVLNRLLEKRLLEDADEKPAFEISPEEVERYDHQITFFSHYHENKYELQGRLKNAHVAVAGLGSIGSRIAASLARSGVGKLTLIDNQEVTKEDSFIGGLYTGEHIGNPRCEVAEKICAEISPHAVCHGIAESISGVDRMKSAVNNCTFVVAASDVPQVALFEWVNKACIEREIPWISCSLNGEEALIGPTVIPHETACFTCYELRMKANVPRYDEYSAFENYVKTTPQAVSQGMINSFSGIVANIAALESIKTIADFADPSTYNKLLAINLILMEFTFHTILKLPLCPDCGFSSREIPKERVWMDRYESL
jgi:thiazole/oxazole-forming peptide maturase SagC family component